MGRHPSACWRATRSTQIGWLDQFFKGYETILNAGQLLAARARINLAAPLVATDDAANKWTSIAISPASSTAAGSLSAADFAKLQAPTVVTQPAVGVADGATGVASAPSGASRTVSRVDFIPLTASGTSLAADDTNYLIATLTTLNPATGATTTIGSRNSKTGASGGTGDWLSGEIAFSFTVPVVIPAGQLLIINWSHGGVVAIPLGSFLVF